MKNPPIQQKQRPIEKFLFLGGQINPELDIDNEETKNKILKDLKNEGDKNLTDRFCKILKSNLLVDNFTNFQDQNKTTINKIKNSLEILKNFGHDLGEKEKKEFLYIFGKNFYKIQHLLEGEFDEFRKNDSFTSWLNYSRQRDWVLDEEITPMMNLYCDSKNDSDDKFIGMIAKSFIMNQKFDKDLFNETISKFNLGDKKIFIRKMQQLLLDNDQLLVNVNDVFNFLNAYTSLKKIKDSNDNNPEFESRFFSTIRNRIEILSKHSNFATELGKRFIANIEINEEETKNVILDFFKPEINTELKQKFCNGLKSSLIDHADGFTNDEDQQIIRINKIKNSLEILNELGHGLNIKEKQDFSYKFGKNFYKIRHLLQQDFNRHLDMNSFDRGCYSSFDKDWVPKKEIQPMLDLFVSYRGIVNDLDPINKQKFIKMIAKSFIKADEFDNSSFNIFNDSEKTILIKEMRSALIEKVQSQQFDIDKVLEIYKTLIQFPSSDQENNQFNNIMIENILEFQFKNTDRKIEQFVQEKLLGLNNGDEFNEILVSQLFAFLSKKNASFKSSDKLDYLLELSPNFAQMEAFKKVFYIKIGKEFNPCARECNYGETVIKSINENSELAGYFCEGLSEILINNFENKRAVRPYHLDNLKNRFELFKLLSRDSYNSMQEKFSIIQTALQNRNGFTEGSKTKIRENLETFNKKFAQDFVKYLTKINESDSAEKQKANALIKDIRENGSFELIKEINDLLENYKRSDNRNWRQKGIKYRELEQSGVENKPTEISKPEQDVSCFDYCCRLFCNKNESPERTQPQNTETSTEVLGITNSMNNTPRIISTSPSATAVSISSDLAFAGHLLHHS